MNGENKKNNVLGDSGAFAPPAASGIPKASKIPFPIVMSSDMARKRFNDNLMKLRGFEEQLKELQSI